MPSPEQILEHLARAADASRWLAFAWHVATAVALVAIAAGWRPSRRTFGRLVAAPLGTVFVVAVADGNPFNASIMGASAVALVAFAGRCEPAPVRAGARATLPVGATLVVLGWAYPEFLGGHEAWRYFVAAPVGVLPCPTLLLVTGATILAGGLGSRRFSILLALVGLWFGLTGALALGVMIDWVLAAGALTLLAVALRRGGAKG